MDYYFGSVPPNSLEGQYIIETGGCILNTQYREKNLINQWVDIKKTLQPDIKIFVDSGAFSAHTQGVDIDIDDYISYLNEIIEDIEICAALDVIGDPQKSWENYLYMIDRVAIPEKVLYTYHFGEDIEFLENSLKYISNKFDSPYIAIGGVALIKDATLRVDFLYKTVDVLKKYPNVKYHLFGVTDFKILNVLPCTSVDSTTHIMCGAFGKIFLPTHDGWLKAIRPDSFETSMCLDEINFYLNKYNITLDELIESRNHRVYFNCRIIIDTIHNFKPSTNMNLGKKKSLW